MNRLGDATSPYLLQHADNPVDWWPWGEEALAEARRRDVPVLISIGYSSCHWCHVMARESFEDEAVGALINERFVPIKVDREEHPDVDAVYMTATQAMTGQGGWPMTVFATPDGEPFLCGTYFPKRQFMRVLEAVSTAWRDQRDDVLRQGASVVSALARVSSPTGPGVPVTADVLDSAVSRLAAEYDAAYGGFGGAPKFPPHMELLFLLRHHARTGDAQALEMVRHTCEQMARGGLYDQLAGGFARYSVDATWTVPHFEKMLYDNALLLRVYTDLWRQSGDALAARIARETTDFLLRDLLLPGGGFASALDAEAEGEEGATYIWTPGTLREALGDVDGAWAADLFGVTDAGNFEGGTSVLRLARNVDWVGAEDVDDTGDALRRRVSDVRARLLAARAQRPQPERDDKVVAAWNGLVLTALVEYVTTVRAVAPDDADQRLRLDRVTTAVRDTAEVLARHMVDGRLRRVSRDGVVGEPAGVLDDYGCVAEAFCAVHQLTGEGRWLALAKTLLDTALERFGDGAGGFYDTADDAPQLITRPADPTDNATPSGRSAIAAALTAYTALAGEPCYREAAQSALATVAPLIARHPRAAGYAAAVGEALLSGPYEIAIVTDAPTTDPLVLAAHRLAPPGAVVVAGAADQPGVPLLADRPKIDGRSTAYVCRGFVCDQPVTDVDALAEKLTVR